VAEEVDSSKRQAVVGAEIYMIRIIYEPCVFFSSPPSVNVSEISLGTDAIRFNGLQIGSSRAAWNGVIVIVHEKSVRGCTRGQFPSSCSPVGIFGTIYAGRCCFSVAVRSKQRDYPFLPRRKIPRMHCERLFSTIRVHLIAFID